MKYFLLSHKFEESNAFRPLTEPLREIDVATELDSFYEGEGEGEEKEKGDDEGRIITLHGKQGSKKPFRWLHYS